MGIVMKITDVGKRGVVFSFDDLSTEEYDSPTNVYAIIGEKHIFICDTFLGPGSMKGVKDYLKKYSDKTIIIFNSHYDWDHHWRNCAFPNARIYAHHLTREKIIEEGEKGLETYKKFQRGKITITPPNTVFYNALSFVDEQVDIFHSPGHTEDSSSCFDLESNVLFVGDNVEDPVPYIRSDLDGVLEYVETLELYYMLEFDKLIPGHGPIADKKLLKQNLDYLKHFPELEEPVNLEKYGKEYYHIHLQNLSTLASERKKKEQYEDAIKYYQKIIELSTDNEILKHESIERVKDRIKEIKKEMS
ncbi:MAG: MBL fold metallo-hydrolase [Asgard group archaeon]|nr:MBL fold metallo-hydrolase [Asgard group archaeon]